VEYVILLAEALDSSPAQTELQPGPFKQVFRCSDGLSDVVFQWLSSRMLATLHLEQADIPRARGGDRE
jgi:hypothetical protein